MGRRRNASIKKVIPYIDILVTTDNNFPWENHIDNYLHLSQGIDPEDFNYAIGSNEGRTYDVIYTGSLTSREPERIQALEEIGQKFKSIIYTSSNGDKLPELKKLTLKGSVYGKDFFDAYQQAKVAFVPRPPSEIKENYWSNRIYLAATTGTCCLVEYVNGLEKEFVNSKEVIYSYNDSDSIDKIRFLLESPGLRARMGRNARKRTLENYKYSDRVKKILEVL